MFTQNGTNFLAPNAYIDFSLVPLKPDYYEGILFWLFALERSLTYSFVGTVGLLEGIWLSLDSLLLYSSLSLTFKIYC